MQRLSRAGVLTSVLVLGVAMAGTAAAETPDPNLPPRDLLGFDPVEDGTNAYGSDGGAEGPAGDRGVLWSRIDALILARIHAASEAEVVEPVDTNPLQHVSPPPVGAVQAPQGVPKHITDPEAVFTPTPGRDASSCAGPAGVVDDTRRAIVPGRDDADAPCRTTAPTAADPTAASTPNPVIDLRWSRGRPHDLPAKAVHSATALLHARSAGGTAFLGDAEEGSGEVETGMSLASATGAVPFALPAGVAPVLRDSALILMGLAGLACLPPLWRLYRRLAHGKVLENAVRRRTYDTVMHSPGVTAGALARALGVDRRTAIHHLEVLREFKLIESRPVGARTCYYQNGGTYNREEKVAHVALASEKARRLLKAVIQAPQASLGAVAETTGIPKSTVKFHLDRFRRLGLLREEGQVAPEAVDVLTRQGS